jgi:hypothetical protein
MNIQEFAKELVRGDWTADFSDDPQVWRNYYNWLKDIQDEADRLGHNGKRLFELAKSYFHSVSSTPSGNEWRLVASILWVNGIKMPEQEIKDKFVARQYIKWSTINTTFQQLELRTW